MLTVNTLGRFQVTDGKNIISDDSLHSSMLLKLFTYMLLYRDKTLTIDDIAGALWQEEETDNPAGALKNLMYRLRKTLSVEFDNVDFVLTNRGSYRWNPEVEVVLDVEQFEELVAEAKIENVYEDAIQKYEQALAIYQGGFMTKIADMHWIATLQTYYHSLYLSVVKALAGLYKQTARYEDLEKLCNEALKVENTDEQLYCYQIEARMRKGNIGLALESYEKAREIMEKELGIRKTTVLNKVYEEILSMSKGQVSYNIKEVKKDINEENPEGVFFCGYPIFKEIYHLEVRKSIRSTDQEELVLLTVETIQDDPKEIAEFRIKQAMTALEDVIRESLRVGDVAARYSESQYILLLPTCNKDLALLVSNRIISKLYEKNEKYKNVRIRINVEEVSAEGILVK